MSMKLVRTDSSEPCKIQLTIGEHFFGRGKLLGCDDKRISRNHGHLQVYDNHITIKALHQNPCFYTKCGTNEKQILKKDELINLSNGDRFGLLPDAFWYEVLHCALHTQQLQNEMSDKDTEDYTLEQDPETNENKTASLEIQNAKCDETNDNGNVRAESPSLIEPANFNSDLDGVANSCIHPDKVDIFNITKDQNSELPENESRTANEEDVNKEKIHVLKRNHSSEQLDGIKKVKAEATEVTRELNEVHSASIEVKQEVKEEGENEIACNNIQPGPSLCQAGDGGSANGNADASQPNNPLRERCMYGVNCYRKNPVHLAQFSHPRDADWGAGDRAPCPYGAACTRRDPRHHRDHHHPPSHRPPPPPPARPGKRTRSGNSPPPRIFVMVKRKRRVVQRDKWSESEQSENDSENEKGDTTGKIRKTRGSSSPPSADLIVTGKRTRKTVQRDEWSGSDDEPDPYGTDEEDEWRPQPGDSQDFSEDV